MLCFRCCWSRVPHCVVWRPGPLAVYVVVCLSVCTSGHCRQSPAHVVWALCVLHRRIYAACGEWRRCFSSFIPLALSPRPTMAYYVAVLAWHWRESVDYSCFAIIYIYIYKYIHKHYIYLYTNDNVGTLPVQLCQPFFHFRDVCVWGVKF